MLLYPGWICWTRFRTGPGASLWFLQLQSHQHVQLLTLNLNMWIKIISTTTVTADIRSYPISRYFSQYWILNSYLMTSSGFYFEKKTHSALTNGRWKYRLSQYSACTVSLCWILVRNTLINILHNFTISWSYRTQTIHQPIRSCVCVTRLFLSRTATAFVCCRRPAGSPL